MPTRIGTFWLYGKQLKSQYSIVIGIEIYRTKQLSKNLSTIYIPITKLKEISDFEGLFDIV